MAVSGVRVQTPLGAVEGRRLHDGVAEFRGLRYAEPTRTRWSPPKPKTSWSGVVEALDWGHVCPTPPMSQRTGIRYNATSEDCLTLNLWSPALPSHPNASFPILLWLYGSGFVGGALMSPARLSAWRRQVLWSRQ